MRTILSTLIVCSMGVAIFLFSLSYQDKHITPVYAQGNCNLSGTFTTAGRSAPFDNRILKCNAFTFVAQNNSGFSGLTIEVDVAPDNNGVAGSWSAATATTGSNPCTSTDTCFTIYNLGNAWFSINFSGLTGTGRETWKLVGVNTLTNQAKSATSPPSGAAGGDLSGTYPNPTVAKVNGNTPGSTCTNQFTRTIDTSARGSCATVQNTDLANNSVTVNSTAPLSGGGAVALGSSITLSCPTCSTGSTTPFYQSICSVTAQSNSTVPALCVANVASTLTIPANALNTIGQVFAMHMDYSMSNSSGAGIGIQMIVSIAGSTFTSISFTIPAGANLRCSTELYGRTVTTGSSGTFGFPGGTSVCNNAALSAPQTLLWATVGDPVTNLTVSNSFSINWSSNVNAPLTINEATIRFY